MLLKVETGSAMHAGANAKAETVVCLDSFITGVFIALYLACLHLYNLNLFSFEVSSFY
jgi:hypothetical protein